MRLSRPERMRSMTRCSSLRAGLRSTQKLAQAYVAQVTAESAGEHCVPRARRRQSSTRFGGGSRGQRGFRWERLSGASCRPRRSPGAHRYRRRCPADGHDSAFANIIASAFAVDEASSIVEVDRKDRGPAVPSAEGKVKATGIVSDLNRLKAFIFENRINLKVVAMEREVKSIQDTIEETRVLMTACRSRRKLRQTEAKAPGSLPEIGMRPASRSASKGLMRFLPAAQRSCSPFSLSMMVCKR